MQAPSSGKAVVFHIASSRLSWFSKLLERAERRGIPEYQHRSVCRYSHSSLFLFFLILPFSVLVIMHQLNLNEVFPRICNKVIT